MTNNGPYKTIRIYLKFLLVQDGEIYVKIKLKITKILSDSQQQPAKPTEIQNKHHTVLYPTMS